MHPLTLILLLAAGGCEALYRQKLTCNYELKHKSLPRVWCRQSSSDCCVGLTFSQGARLVDEGKLEVTQGPDSFTVAMLIPTHGEGMYWCGVLSENDTIIKLAEGYFHKSSGAYIWSVTRWILLPLLPMLTIFTNVYFRTTKNTCKKEEEPYDDITVNKPLTHSQHENAASFCEPE